MFSDVFYTANIFFNENIVFWIILNIFIGACFASCIGLVVARYPAMLKWQMDQDVKEYLLSKDTNKVHDEKDSSDENKKPDGLWWPPSRCDSCHNELKFWHNIPILGWIMLRGKCAFCHAKIPFSVLGVELIGCSMGGLLAYYIGVSPMVWLWLVAGSLLLAAILIDWECGWLPDSMVLPLMWMGIFSAYFFGGQNYLPTLEQSILGVASGYGILWFINIFSKIVFRKQGIGDGDLKLLAAMGAWFGSVWVLNGFMLSTFIAIGFHFLHQNREKKRKELNKESINDFVEGGFPFGPSLALGVILAYIIGYFNIVEGFPIIFNF